MYGKIKKYGHRDVVKITGNLYGHRFSYGENVSIMGTFKNSTYRLYVAQSLETLKVYYIGDEECELVEKSSLIPMYK